MELLFALIIATLVGAGVFLILRASTFPVIIGLCLFSYAANVFLFLMGRIHDNAPPILSDQAINSLGEAAQYADPLPQALVLTAIVIGFAMTAFVLVLALKARSELGHDQVNHLELQTQADAHSSTQGTS